MHYLKQIKKQKEILRKQCETSIYGHKIENKHVIRFNLKNKSNEINKNKSLVKKMKIL